MAYNTIATSASRDLSGRGARRISATFKLRESAVKPASFRVAVIAGVVCRIAEAGNLLIGGVANHQRHALVGKSGPPKKPTSPYGNNYAAKHAHQKIHGGNKPSLSFRFMTAISRYFCDKDHSKPSGPALARRKIAGAERHCPGRPRILGIRHTTGRWKVLQFAAFSLPFCTSCLALAKNSLISLAAALPASASSLARSLCFCTCARRSLT